MGPRVQGRQAPNASCPTFALRPGFLRGGVQVQTPAGLEENFSCSLCRTMDLLCKTPTPTQSGWRDCIQESKSFCGTDLGFADLVGWEFLSRTPDFIQDLRQTPQTVTQTTGELPWLIQLLLMHQTSQALEVLVIATRVSSVLRQALPPPSLSVSRRLVSQYSVHPSRAPTTLRVSADPSSWHWRLVRVGLNMPVVRHHLLGCSSLVSSLPFASTVLAFPSLPPFFKGI